MSILNIPTDVKNVNWDKWQFTEDAVLCFIERGEEFLLIHKKRGLGKGKINAPGGRIDPGETALEAAVRECQEEVCMTPSELEYVTELNFIFLDGYSLRGYVYRAKAFTGTPTETDEAKPFWCRKSEIPYDRMWQDDQYWIPLMLKGKFVTGRFIFDDDKMLSMNLEIQKKAPQLSGITPHI